MDRPDISRLNKNRNTFLKLGFIISLSLTILAFDYTITDQNPETYQAPIPMEVEELVTVQRTVHKEKKVLPPLSIKPTEKFIEEDLVFDPTPELVESVIEVDAEPVEDLQFQNLPPHPKPPIIVPDEPKEDIVEIPPLIVEQMPRFAGCEGEDLKASDRKLCADQKLLEFIYSNIKYPPTAINNEIEGVVVVTFVVEKDGSLSGLKITRDIGGGCGNEVLRVVKKMPDWIAGEQRGRKVRVQFKLPVKFTLH